MSRAFRSRTTYFLIALSVLSACSSVPEESNAAKVALLGEPTLEYVAPVELSFRKKIAFMSDSEIESYLSAVAQRFFPPGKVPLQVSLVSTLSAGYEPSVWVIPGGKIFFDVRTLRALHFENEIAAGIVLAWERSQSTEFRERLIEESSRANPDPTKIWNFALLENERAIEAAVDRIYKAGYDPRGLVNYFDRIAGPTSKNQIETDQEALKNKVRRSIAFYAPLLNPIVRTEEFYKMRKRLERL